VCLYIVVYYMGVHYVMYEYNIILCASILYYIMYEYNILCVSILYEIVI